MRDARRARKEEEEDEEDEAWEGEREGGSIGRRRRKKKEKRPGKESEKAGASEGAEKNHDPNCEVDGAHTGFFLFVLGCLFVRGFGLVETQRRTWKKGELEEEEEEEGPGKEEKASTKAPQFYFSFGSSPLLCFV
jgi:hypothetical protein